MQHNENFGKDQLGAHRPFHDLGEITKAGGKKVSAWAFEGDCDPAHLKSNVCEIEWPPRSKRTIQIPEVDRRAWFPLSEARRRILKGQVFLLNRLEDGLTPLSPELLP
jgi:predicted NUDIX family NTP pyrophosphohydrolase